MADLPSGRAISDAPPAVRRARPSKVTFFPERIAYLKIVCERLRLLRCGQPPLIQAGVYLAEAAGVDLGYDFRWRGHGPHSDDLEEDFVQVAVGIGRNWAMPEGLRLKTGDRFALSRVRRLVYDPPEGVSWEDWLEVLAATHITARVPTRVRDECLGFYFGEKPAMRDFWWVADHALKRLEAGQGCRPKEAKNE